MALQNKFVVCFEYINDRVLLDEQLSKLFNIPTTHKEYSTVNNAYFQVVDQSGNKELINFDLHIYLDETKTTLLATEKHSFIPDVSSEYTPNFIKQAYDYLKSLPGYESSIDC